MMAGSPGIIISYEELKILLYNRGFRSCSGILMPDREFSDEEILQAMNNLALRGMIEAQEDYFVITPETVAMVDAIGNPDSSYPFTDPETGQIYYCYLTQEMIVVTQMDWNRKETLRISRFTPEEFRNWREELESE